LDAHWQQVGRVMPPDFLVPTIWRTVTRQSTARPRPMVGFLISVWLKHNWNVFQ
jgi:hypothetical protein